LPTGEEEMRKKGLLIFVLFFMVVVGLLAFFGEKGVVHLLRLKKELARIQERNLKIEEENQRLREEVRRLREERRYIEEIARRELGMVKEDEIVYQFDWPENGKDSPQEQRR